MTTVQPEMVTKLNSRGETVTVPVYRCRRCRHTVDEHPMQFAYTDWNGSHHAKSPCDCRFYVPTS